MENKHISIQQPLLTLCISTDGSLEWVRSVLQSIEQHIEEGENRFEVVVTDNGNNAAFVEFMKAYVLEHQYVRYKKTNVQGFLNLCEAFRMAEGVFVKFIKKRITLKKGTLAYYMGFVKKHITDEERPIVYFSNGTLKNYGTQLFGTFDAFVGALGIYGTWSGGIAFWRDDVQSWIPEHSFHPMFPNTDILFHERHRKQYIVDDTELLDCIPVEDNQKGHYDLYWTFAVDFPTILFDMVRE